MIQTNRTSVCRSTGDNAAVVPDAPLLSRFANDPEMRDIVALFVAEAPDRLADVTRAWEAGDLRRVRTIAHQIKGAAGGYGFPEVSDAAGELESAAGVLHANAESAGGAFIKFTNMLSRVACATPGE